MQDSNVALDNGSRRAAVRPHMAIAMVAVGLSLPTLTIAQSMPAETVDAVKRATVMVKMSYSQNSEGDTPLATGTGFFVNSTGLCITNNHVIDPGHQKTPQEKFAIWRKYNRLTYRVIVESGTPEEQTYKAKVLYHNDQADMAVMQVYDADDEFLETPDSLRFRPTSEVPAKTKLWGFGFPGGESRRQSSTKNALIAVQSGGVLGVPRSPSGRAKNIRTSILADGGNSGGPVVDRSGRVVGIATLAGPGDTGASFTILVPADLTRKMIRIAFNERRIPGGVDIDPFLESLIDEHRVFKIPSIERSKNNSCITKDDGSVLCGKPADDTITWPTPIGDLQIPTRLLAYVVVGEDHGTVLLDGGDRFLIDPDEARLSFLLGGTEPYTTEISDVTSVAFRLPDDVPTIPEGDVFVIGGPDFHLSLKNPKGKVVFRTSDGVTMKIPITDITRIEYTEDDETRLHTIHGSRITGEFGDHEITATLAWSNTPVKFSFGEDVQHAVMKTVNFQKLLRKGEPPLVESISTSDPRFARIAAALDAGDITSAKAQLDVLLEPETFRRLSKQKKDEIRRLDGEYLFRNGEFAFAGKVFKKLKRSDVEDIRWHARARLAMLARFEGGKFESRPISQPAVFSEAGSVLAKESLQKAKLMLEELETFVGKESPGRAEYMKMVRRAKGTEEALLVANRLLGGSTEELIVRLWRNVSYLHINEAGRLQAEQAKLNDASRSGSNNRARGGRDRRMRDAKLKRLKRDQEKALEAFEKMQRQLADAGFIIDDSNVEFGDDE